MFLSKESTADSTAMIEKIPMVTPNNDKNVRSLLLRNALIANEKLSLNNRK
jgi:ribosomal protein S2